MTRFAWTARSHDGRTLQGSREAGSEAAVLEHLRSSGLLVLAVRPARMRSDGGLGLWRLLRPRPVDVEIGLRQVAVMLRSGLPLLTALHTCAAQAPRRSLAEVWRAISLQVQAGSSLSDALASHRCFPPIATSLAAVGERTGELDVVLERAAEAMERRRRHITALLTALTYPTIVLLMAVATTTYMLVALIPKLTQFLASLGRRLPPMTQFLVDVSNFMSVHAAELLLLVALLLALVLMFGCSKRRTMIDPLLLRTPLIGKIVRLSGAAIFARNVSLLLASGVRVTDALAVVEPLLPNAVLRRSTARVRERVLQGAGFSESMAGESRAFEPLLVNMAAVGESSGTLDKVLDDVADFHDRRLQELIERLGTILEPIIVITIGAIVGFVYLAFFMAIYSIAGN